MTKLGSDIEAAPSWFDTSDFTFIAMVMAAVAVLGAVAAYRTEVAGEETERLERKLDQGQMLELKTRQELLDKAALRVHFEERSRLAFTKAEFLQRKADKLRLRPQDSATANLLDLQTEEEFAVARSINPFLYFAWVDLDKDLGLENSLEKGVAAELAKIGFETVWPEKGGMTEAGRLFGKD
jgi:hypothetical protein